MESTTTAAIQDIPILHESAEVCYDDRNCVFVYLCLFCNNQFYCNNLFIKHLSNEHFVEVETQKEQIYYPIECSEQEAELQSYDEWDQLTDKGSVSLIRYSPETICNINDEDEVDTTGFELNAKVIESGNSYDSEKTNETKNEDQVPIEADSSSTKVIAKAKAKARYQCVHCQKQYQSKRSLENHRKAHENVEKIKCRHESCSKTFTSSSGYFHHMRTHNKENPFQCEFCAKGFYHKCNLQVHIRRCHTLDKPFNCQHCEKAFASSTDRQIHERLHTGEKPYFCDKCDKEFITASKLSYHRKLHFEVKKYCCKKCDGKFSTRVLLYKHSLDHSSEKSF